MARIAIAAVALPILALTAASAIGAHLIDSSQSDARAHDLHSAYDAAKDAGKFMPWAATPHEQQALVLEQWGGFGFANVEVHKAIEKEPTNWEPYYVLSRIYREIGNLPDARTEYAQARSLNPHSPIFAAHPNRTLPLSLGD